MAKRKAVDDRADQNHDGRFNIHISCVLCGVRLTVDKTIQEALVNHVLAVHGSPEDRGPRTLRTRMCDLCGEVVKIGSAWYYHQRTHASRDKWLVEDYVIIRGKSKIVFNYTDAGAAQVVERMTGTKIEIPIPEVESIPEDLSVPAAV